MKSFEPQPLISRGRERPRGREPLLQDAYLAELHRQSVPVTVYLVNGFQLRGTVKGFDPYTVVLDYEHREHLVYKHAISTISPNGPVAGSLIAGRRPDNL